MCNCSLGPKQNPKKTQGMKKNFKQAQKRAPCKRVLDSLLWSQSCPEDFPLQSRSRTRKKFYGASPNGVESIWRPLRVALVFLLVYFLGILFEALLYPPLGRLESRRTSNGVCFYIRLKATNCSTAQSAILWPSIPRRFAVR